MTRSLVPVPIARPVEATLKSSSEVAKALIKNGYKLVRIKGSHHQYKKDGCPDVITIPHPTKDMKTGTLRKIEKQTGIKF